MARAKNVIWPLPIILAAATAMAQTPASTVSSATGSTLSTVPSSTITSSPSLAAASSATASSSSDIPMSLWAIADSLLSSYYPSTTVTQIASLTWPTAVVIGGATYSVHSGTTGGTVPATVTPTGSITTSVLAEATSLAPVSNAHHGLSSDKKLGIAIGVAVGAVALFVLGIVFCCLWRRKKATGAYLLRRRSPSPTDSDLECWRSPRQPEMSTLSSGPSREWPSKHNSMSVQEHPAEMGLQPPMVMHPAYMRHHSSQSISEDNPFFTPQERSEHQYEMQHDLSQHPEVETAAAAAGASSHRHSSNSMRPESRPPTPFSPMAMIGLSSSHAPQQHSNPFTSLEDDEADDVISPIIPARSPERRHSPIVHYPSWDEVSGFDFAGHGRGRASLREQSSNEDGGDGWRPARRESVIGRHELA